MKYKSKVIKGNFVSRPNRFIANVIINGKEEKVHVKNTGRCKELLVPGCSVYLCSSMNPNRKTGYDLIASDKNGNLINMDSQAPNDVAEEWLKNGELFSESAVIKREVKYGNSRFDFYIEDGSRKAFLEVKGVTLENNGIASFPDAPTQRGVKHLKELEKCIKDGYEGYIFFIIQMKGVSLFTPNRKTHPEFAEALVNAEKSGVGIIVKDCIVTPDSLNADKTVKYLL